MFVGVVKFELYMEGNLSLKDKRQQVKSLITKVNSKYPNISIAEVDSLDLWKKATIGFSFVSNNSQFVNSVLDNVFYYIENLGSYYIANKEMDIISFIGE
ncbi:MAG: DUF503 family protein [Candidatus Dadabacteria bacterium]|nr:DUF503 family protein [Candidatus Dadabacteria bacterium]NIQ16370.1 DUF503 family protein [Candidatus Dadabacteria bacterium]